MLTGVQEILGEGPNQHDIQKSCKKKLLFLKQLYTKKSLNAICHKPDQKRILSEKACIDWLKIAYYTRNHTEHNLLNRVQLCNEA